MITVLGVIGAGSVCLSLAASTGETGAGDDEPVLARAAGASDRPAPALRRFRPTGWNGDVAVFRLSVPPADVRAGYAVSGSYRETLRLSRIRRATRRGVLRVRFPAQAARARLVLVVGPRWKRVFRDEFRRPKLNRRTWHTCFWWAPHTCSIETNNELELYNRKDVSVREGILRLRARRREKLGYNGQTFQYTSGMVSTGGLYQQKRPGFTYKYGYAEARVRVPRGKGFWPAFWMVAASYQHPPEIDAMEILGDAPRRLQMHLHYLNADGSRGRYGESWKGPDFSKGWHTFGVDWQPNAITWYADGVKRFRVTDVSAIPDERLYLILNLAVGGDWPGAPDASTDFPGYFDVDYVRVWQRR